jgi:thiosulfate dehydrogenase [quinone] large subunit
MSGGKAARRRPSAASSQPRVVERRHRYGTQRAGASRHSARAQRMSFRDHWAWLAPPANALQLTGWAVLPLRAFLGFTFCFAGLQKLANPGFFSASNPSSIQAQLAGAARRSPIHGLIGPLVHVAIPLGVLIALAELAVGLGTLVGLWTRLAAAGGMIISFSLFLAVSFHSNPYYTGSDIVFVFAWTVLLLGGSGGVLCADALLADLAGDRQGRNRTAIVPVAFETVQMVCGAYRSGNCSARNDEPCAPSPCPYLARHEAPPHTRHAAAIDRRTFTVKAAWTGVLATVGLLGASFVAAVGRVASSSHGSGAATVGAGTSLGSAPSTTTTQGATSGAGPSAPTSSAPHSSAASHPPGTRIGPAADVPVGGSASFQDPSSGDPSLVVQPRAGKFLAFDAVCPHAGCVVQYDQGNKLFACPCHGSVFNGETGAVESGPAPTGLTRLTISNGSDGELYVS